MKLACEDFCLILYLKRVAQMDIKPEIELFIKFSQCHRSKRTIIFGVTSSWSTMSMPITQHNSPLSGRNSGLLCGSIDGAAPSDLRHALLHAEGGPRVRRPPPRRGSGRAHHAGHDTDEEDCAPAQKDSGKPQNYKKCWERNIFLHKFFL